jgi:hypothetical protein
MSDGTCRFTTAPPAKVPVALEPSTLVGGISPLGQSMEPSQSITADRAAFVGDDEEHVKGLEAKVPSS